MDRKKEALFNAIDNRYSASDELPTLEEMAAMRNKSQEIKETPPNAPKETVAGEKPTEEVKTAVKGENKPNLEGKKHNYPNTRIKEKTRVLSFKMTEKQYLKFMNEFDKSKCKNKTDFIIKKVVGSNED